MRAFHKLLFSVLLVSAVLSTSAYGSITVTESENPGLYDYTWTGTFTEVLKDLHSEYGDPSFAQILKDEKSPSTTSVKGQLLHGVSQIIGLSYGRSFVTIGQTPVFYPLDIPLTSPACEALSAKLIVSLTPSQVSIHKSQGYVPFSQLTDAQRETCAFLARNCRDIAPCPEPEFSKRLWESGIVVAMEPVIDYNYPCVDENGKLVVKGLSTSCDREVTKNFWEKHGPGQMSAGLLYTESMIKPGTDVPGDSTVYSLDGAYTLADLLQKVQKEGIRTEVDSQTILIEAHCDMTGAALARACAAATATVWHHNGNGWYLAYDTIHKTMKTFGESTDKYLKEYERALPAIRRMAYDGNMVVVTDTPWVEKFNLQKVLDESTMTWDTLTPSQQAYLRAGAEMYQTPPITENAKFAGLPAALPELTFKWHPNVGLYLLTKDGILYHEWLRFQPMFPPGQEEQFLNPQSTIPETESK